MNKATSFRTMAIILSLASSAHAYDLGTHARITRNAYDQSQLPRGDIFSTLGLADGAATELGKYYFDFTTDYLGPNYVRQEYSYENVLAFPGGYGGALERIAAGEAHAIEAALCFLEVRPYFFRSGYMYKDILRKTKHAPLSSAQASRLAGIVAAYEQYRAQRRHGA